MQVPVVAAAVPHQLWEAHPLFIPSPPPAPAPAAASMDVRAVPPETCAGAETRPSELPRALVVAAAGRVEIWQLNVRISPIYYLNQWMFRDLLWVWLLISKAVRRDDGWFVRVQLLLPGRSLTTGLNGQTKENSHLPKECSAHSNASVPAQFLSSHLSCSLTGL